MDLLAGLMTGTLHAGTPGPTDDFWYKPVGVATASGIRIDDEGAQKISAWYRGRDLLATSLAMLPLTLFRRSTQGREAAGNHPLYDIVHRKPNPWQDAYQWKRQKMFHIVDHGNAYDRIVDGPRGFVDQLWPLDPKRVTPEQIADSGRMLYHYHQQDGRIKTFTQDEIFHLRGASFDGVTGKGILDYARDSLGLGVVLEQYASKLFSRGALNGGVIQVPGPIDKEAMGRMAESYKTAMGDWHMPKILSHGATWTPQTMAPEQAQFILSRKFTVTDIARWLGVPPHMIGDLDRATFTNIEHQGQEFVTYSLGPWLSLWEFAINDQLVLAPQTYYAEFTRDALVRGDIQTRWAAHVAAVNAGIKTVDEVREVENLNARGGPADELRQPANITGGNSQSGPAAAPAQPAQDAQARLTDRAQAIAQASASRLLRKEVTAVRKFAVKHAADQDAFACAVTEFYETHAELVAVTLMMAVDEAREYCAGQAAQALGSEWMHALETWASEHYAAGLAAIALEGEAA
jgi:HK97 family phage portal protein